MVQEIGGFLSADEASLLIECSMKSLAGVKGYGDDVGSYRTASQAKLTEPADIVERIDNLIADILSVAKERLEYPVIVRYTKGGEYKKHYDFFDPSQSYAERELSRGGQRRATALIYLNDDFKGGHTCFPRLKRKIAPETGKLVIWDNVSPDGSPDIDSLHAGLPVRSGEKYILVVWVREGIFRKKKSLIF